MVRKQLCRWSGSSHFSPGPGCWACLLYLCLCAAGSTSSSLCDHWINRLPGSRAASLASGASSRRTSLASLAESVEFPAERSEDDGETRLLPTAFSFWPQEAKANGHFLVSRRIYRPAFREEHPAPELVLQVVHRQPLGVQRQRDQTILVSRRQAEHEIQLAVALLPRLSLLSPTGEDRRVLRRQGFHVLFRQLQQTRALLRQQVALIRRGEQCE